MLAIRYGSLYGFFMLVLLTTEFFYIQIGGGIARPYHFLAAVLALSCVGAVHRLFRSKTFVALVLFAIVSFISSVTSTAPEAAISSFLSFVANVLIVVVVAVALSRGHLTIERFSNILAFVTIVSVAWGAIQIVGLKGGLVLALSPEQQPQILIGFGPGFRTEANTFGKFMLVPFLLFLPLLLNNRGDRKLWVFYSVMLVGIFMNFTRTAIFGITAAILFASGWYAVTGQLNKVTLKFFALASAISIGVLLVVTGAVPLSEYARFKVENFFNKEEILQGGSSSYRLEAMQAVLSNALDSFKSLVIGNGWGQTYFVVAGQEVQAGGGDVINILGFAGLLGVSCYLLYSLLSVLTVSKVARRARTSEERLFAEGVLFAVVGVFVTAQFSGYIISPEYYLLLGACVYLGMKKANSDNPAATSS